MTEYEVSSVIPASVVLIIAAGAVGGLFALARWMLGRMIREVDLLEGRFERLLAELPVKYQMRDDSIREYTAINARLDRIYELLLMQQSEKQT